MNLREAFIRFTGLWNIARKERELADELEFHLAMKQRKYQQVQGMDATRAAQKAKRDFGGFEKWKEVSRDVTRWRLLEDLVRDLFLALRLLRKSPVFTTVALLTLTLAIGANTAIFSLMNAVILKALPVPHPEQLALVRQMPSDSDVQGFTFSYPVFRALKEQSGSPLQVFAFAATTLQMRGNEGVEEVGSQLVSGQYFAALGVQPELGRWLGNADDLPGAPDGPVAVISYKFWRGQLGGDPHVLGHRITLNKIGFTVVGVMPDGFRGMSRDSLTDVFIPFELEPRVDAPFNKISQGYTNWWFHVGARLRPGASLEHANAFLKTGSSLYFNPPGGNFTFNGHSLSDFYLIAEPGANGFSYLRLRFKQPLTVLMGLVVMVLLIACLNLATLLMARASSRGREITTRFTLGASRVRLLRQLLTESLVLAVIGTVLGLAVSPLLTSFIAAVLTSQQDSHSSGLDAAPDLTVFAFTAVIAIFSTVLTGTLPALRSTGNGLNANLREGSATLRGVERRQIWPRVLLSLEVAFAMILVTGATLLGYSLTKLHQTPVGFDPHGLIYLPIDVATQPVKGERLVAAYRNILQQISRQPGVSNTALSAVIPLSGNWASGDVKTPGGQNHELWTADVGPAYFQTMRIHLLEGREFLWTDTPTSGRKAILNQLAAKILFPQGHAIGRYVTFDGASLIQVVGVVADAKYSAVQDASPPTIYSSVLQNLAPRESINILIRATGSPSPLVAAAGKTVRQFMPEAPLPSALNLDDTLAESLTSERMMAMLALFFGGLALLMTGIGLYGTLAYTTERRTGEIGIRLALGARRAAILSMVCSENGAIAIAGCLLGVAGSFLASKTIESFLYGVSARDPLLFGVAVVVLLCVAASASLLPALKASRIDPIAAIRYE